MKNFQRVNIALVGNQNCGKTTFFNALTGKHKKTGNFPGVTVEKVYSDIKKNNKYRVYDLPGLYSLSSLTEEEKIAEDFLRSKEVDVIFNIVDSTNIRRNIFLTFQLAKFNKPMLVIFNMADEMKKRNIEFDIGKFSELTGLTCIFTSARKGVDVSEIVNLTSEIMNTKLEINYENEKEIYPLADSILDLCLTENNNKELCKTDKILLNRFVAFPFFLIVMLFIFFSVFKVASTLSSAFFENAETFLLNIIKPVNPLMSSFIKDGLFKGIFCVLSFLPAVLLLFFFLALLEDSGYMARISFIFDKLMRKTGLSGKALFPVMLGFGCSVPSVMSTRILSCQKEKRCAMRLIPFVSCSAKLPVFLYICNLFFSEQTAIIITAVYGGSFALGCLFSSLFSHGENDFLLELPTYRIPSFKNTFFIMYERTKEFLFKVFTIIVLCSVAIWFLSTFDFDLNITQLNESMLVKISEKISFIFAPLGFGDCRIISSLICGIGAKEAVISTLSILSANTLFTPASALSFLIFTSLYTPCISTLITIKKESGSILFSFKTALFQFVVAWCISFIFYSFMLPFSV